MPELPLAPTAGGQSFGTDTTFRGEDDSASIRYAACVTEGEGVICSRMTTRVEGNDIAVAGNAETIPRKRWILLYHYVGTVYVAKQDPSLMPSAVAHAIWWSRAGAQADFLMPLYGLTSCDIKRRNEIIHLRAHAIARNDVLQRRHGPGEQNGGDGEGDHRLDECEAALEGDQSFIPRMCKAFKERHDYVVGELNGMPGVRCLPGQGTFYTLANVEGLIARTAGVNNDVDLAEHIMNAAGVALVPGSAFGAPGYVRLSIATVMATLQEALRRIQALLDK